MSPVNWLREKVMGRSRGNKLRQFFSLCRARIHRSRCWVAGSIKGKPGQALNYFLEHYTRDPETYTGLGIDDMTGLRQKCPSMKFVQYDGRHFPFADKQFDWAFSNAVIEHVGVLERQQLFVKEMLRVAREVFFTTPNMFFPVETHTNQLFIHWNRKKFDDWLVTHRPALVSNLRLLDLQELTQLMEASIATHYQIYKNRLLGWPMTFSVYART